MNISLIIPTYNAEKYLSVQLTKLYDQSQNNFELIIIDSSSSDNTVKIARQYTDKVIIIPTSEFDHGGTRAKAVEIANGEILIFFTQDALPYNEYCIENIISVFDDENVAAAYGRQLSYQDTNFFGKHLREFNYPDLFEVRTILDIKRLGIKAAQLSNSFTAYRKDKLLELGNFKSNLILGEDSYMAAKILLAGFSIVYTSNAKVYHPHSYTICQEFKRYFDIGVFHQCEKWILDDFGKAENEGEKYIRSELKYLLNHNAWYLIPEFFLRNAMKYLGYKLGQNYRKLPKILVPKLSMHYRWWSKNKGAHF